MRGLKRDYFRYLTGLDFEQNEWKTSTEIQRGIQRMISFNKVKQKRSEICTLHLLPTRDKTSKFQVEVLVQMIVSYYTVDLHPVEETQGQ